MKTYTYTLSNDGFGGSGSLNYKAMHAQLLGIPTYATDHAALAAHDQAKGLPKSYTYPDGRRTSFDVDSSNLDSGMYRVLTAHLLDLSPTASDAAICSAHDEVMKDNEVSQASPGYERLFDGAKTWSQMKVNRKPMPPGPASVSPENGGATSTSQRAGG